MKLFNQQIYSFFLRRHDMIFEEPAARWEQGVFMGNGMLGTVVWGGGDSPMKISLDRADIWEIRNEVPDYMNGYTWKTFSECMEKQDYDRFFKIFVDRQEGCPRPTRFHIGRMEFSTKGKVLSHTMRFHLAEAVTSGVTETEVGTVNWKTWVAATENVIVVDMTCTGEERLNLNLKYIARGDYTDADVRESTRYQAHGDQFGRLSDMLKSWEYPESVSGETGEVSWWYQVIPENGGIATAYKIIHVDSGHDILVYTIHCDRIKANCAADAVLLIQDYDKEKVRELYRAHIEWWKHYYSASFVSIPDTKLEALYYIETYKLACSTHPGGMHMTLCGPWTDDDNLSAYCSNDYHWNLEQEMQLWPVYTANRLEFAMPMYDMIDRCRPNLHQFCRNFFERDGEFLAHCTDLDCKPLGGIDNYEFNGLPWVCFMYWQHYLYSMDEIFLKERAYPLMREAVRPLILELKEGEDGYLHLPWTSSPEYHSAQETYRWVHHEMPDWTNCFGADATIDLSLLKFLCRTLIKITEILDIEDKEKESWERTLDKLVPYHMDEFGSLVVRAGLPITTSHRHQSHLFPIYPLHEMTMDTDADTIRNCLTVLGINGRGEWVGWSFAWVALLGAYGGRAAMARNILLDYADRYITESTVHYQGPQGSCDISLYETPAGNFGNTIEAGFGCIAAIQELAIQSVNGVIRLFENTPPAWSNLALYNMRTEGAFLVSGVREMYITKFAYIYAENGGKLILRSDFGSDSLHVEINGTHREYLMKDGALTLETAVGDVIVIWAGDTRPEITVRPLEGNENEYNYYGVKKIKRF
ncbi:MAG: hypothetical protein K2O40_12940 [Lachnospiraceae bacterium]|nr:hypothetical protein [Lachnospiraceae bacterium]